MNTKSIVMASCFLMTGLFGAGCAVDASNEELAFESTPASDSSSPSPCGGVHAPGCGGTCGGDGTCIAAVTGGGCVCGLGACENRATCGGSCTIVTAGGNSQGACTESAGNCVCQRSP